MKEFSRYVAVMLTLLMGVTWRLWFDVDGPFPTVPAFGFNFLPSLLVPVAAIIAIAAVWTNHRAGWAMTAIALGVCFLTDQATLQPWAYQIALYAALFALAPGTLTYHRAIAISLYLYSGIGKLDYQFAHTVGFEFLQTLSFGWIEQRTPVVVMVVLLLPTIEAAAAIGLYFRRTRRPAAAIILFIHVSLIAILGPWSLDHSWGVLVWNVLLIGQTYGLFLRTEPARPAPDRSVVTASTHSLSTQSLSTQSLSTQSLPATESLPANRSPTAARSLPASILTVVVVLGPLTERSGHWDHWLAWQLYAPHTGRVDAEISQSVVPQLGPLEYFVDDDPDGDRWHHLELATASLHLRGVPLYPQARYQRQLLRCIAQQRDLRRGVRGIEKGPADRWTGRRREEYFVGDQ